MRPKKPLFRPTLAAIIIVLGGCSSSGGTSARADDDDPIDHLDGLDSSPGDTTAPPEPPLNFEPGVARIVTWNLETFPLTRQAREGAERILRDIQPDIMAIQEIASPQTFALMVENLGGYDFVLNEDPEGRLRLGLAYRRGRVLVDDVATLYRGDFDAFPRPPLKAQVTVVDGDAGDIDFTIVVIHHKAFEDDESRRRRQAANATLDGWIENHQQTSGNDPDVMVLGDFNDELTDALRNNTFGPLLEKTDAYEFLTLPLEQRGEHSFVPFRSMIDHVMITTEMRAEVGRGQASVLPVDRTSASFASITDHRPVETVLRWEDGTRDVGD